MGARETEPEEVWCWICKQPPAPHPAPVTLGICPTCAIQLCVRCGQSHSHPRKPTDHRT